MRRKNHLQSAVMVNVGDGEIRVLNRVVSFGTPHLALLPAVVSEADGSLWVEAGRVRHGMELDGLQPGNVRK